ncbi:pentapeptide repeat-containing protein [uncultured Tateyamaria sp.]|uniref:pentapeptide repeat-containing protein n=1 Tax=uncultured Tateyamaria sp. TaxID=455651 RepID=UPI002624DC22|nr:pentapeptide repeat-containing protein [uncultured Tateyamaria sp.]
MANSEHLSVLRKGIKAWNSHRDAVAFVPDFSNHSFRGDYLQNANFRDANLRNADFTLANLRNADLRGADTKGAVFTGASMLGAHIPVETSGSDENFSVPVEDQIGGLSGSLQDQRADEELRQKIERLRQFDVPNRRYKILNVVIDDSQVRASAISAPEVTAFAEVFETVEKLARDIAGQGYLANTAPALDTAMRRYVEAIDVYYSGGGEILLGLSGQICMREFEANEAALENVGIERTGTIKSFLFSHGLLEKLMPNWMAMLSDAELPSVLGNASKIDDASTSIVAALNRTNGVDKSLPISLQRILDAKKRDSLTAKSITFAVLRALEDVLIELFSVIVKTYKSTREKFTQMSGVVLAASVISVIYAAGAQRLVELSPGLFSWITRGIQWLKEFGLFS